MKKKIIAALCIVLSVFIAIAVLCMRYISNERKTDENNYVLAAKTVAYELDEYLRTGKTEYFYNACGDIIQMNNISRSAGNIVSSDQIAIIENLASAAEMDRDKLTDEAQRLKEAFEIIAENDKDIDYAYAQIKIALSNCGF